MFKEGLRLLRRPYLTCVLPKITADIVFWYDYLHAGPFDKFVRFVMNVSFRFIFKCLLVQVFRRTWCRNRRVCFLALVRHFSRTPMSTGLVMTHYPYFNERTWHYVTSIKVDSSKSLFDVKQKVIDIKHASHTYPRVYGAQLQSHDTPHPLL